MTSIRVFVFFLLSFSLQDIHSNGYSVVKGAPHNFDDDFLNEETDGVFSANLPPEFVNAILAELDKEDLNERQQLGDTTTEPQPVAETLDEDSKESSTVQKSRDSEEYVVDPLPQSEEDISPEPTEVENVERVQSKETKTKSEPDCQLMAEDSYDLPTSTNDEDRSGSGKAFLIFLCKITAVKTKKGESSLNSLKQSEKEIHVAEVSKDSSPVIKTKGRTSTSTNTTEISCTGDNNSVKQEKRYALAVFFKTNWFRAYQYCKYHGMQLATINSQEEELVLESTLGKVGYDLRDVWTSGTDKGEEGNFNWMSTGTPFTYTNWYHGEPNGWNRENCVAIFRATEGYFWNDALCDNEYYFACEYYTADKTDAPTFV